MLPQLSSDVILQLLANEETRWRWISEQVYSKLCEENPDHLLVMVGQRFCFDEMVKRCEGYRRYSGKDGQAATHTLEQLCRASVVKAIYHWSYATLAEEVRCDPLLRWFIGYQLDESPLSDTTLWHFEQWCKAQEERLLFTEILRQIREDFPATSRTIQVGDTFAMQAVCREQSRTEMLREGCHQLLTRLQGVCEPAYAAVMQELDGPRLFGADKEPKEWWLDKTQRNALEIRTAYGALECVYLVRRQASAHHFSQAIEYAGVHRWLGIVEKVLDDEFELEGEGEAKKAPKKRKTAKASPPPAATCPADSPAAPAATQPTPAVSPPQVVAGERLTLRHRSQHVKGSYAHGSMKELEATFRVHGDKTTFGYNINLAADCDFIHEINGVTGATPDATGVAPLVANQKTHLGTVPPKLVYDRAAGRPYYFAEVEKASDGQTQLVARLIDTAKNATRFTPKDFSLGEDGYLTCPNGTRTNRHYPATSAAGRNFRFKAAECTGCPLWDKCRSPEDKPTAHRTVFISDYAYQQRRALAYTKTAEFQLDMQLRPAIERIIAAVTRYNGGRYNKGRGVRNADFQARNAALAYNLKRWRVLMLDKEAATRDKPPDDG